MQSKLKIFAIITLMTTQLFAGAGHVEFSAGEAEVVAKLYSSQINYLFSTLNIKQDDYVISRGNADYSGGMYSSQNIYTFFLKNKTTSIVSELNIEVSRSSNANTAESIETVKTHFKK
jgi:transketolase N-terminal domain/subunit